MASNTNSERKGFTITWIIENFDYSTYRYGDNLEIPTFIVDTMEETKWSFSLSRMRYDDGKLDAFWNTLMRLSDRNGPSSIRIDCECEVLTADGCVARQCNITEQEFSKHHMVFFPFIHLNYGTSADENKNLPPNGNLTVRLKMWKCSGEINNDGYCTARTYRSGKKILHLVYQEFQHFRKRKRTHEHD
ncbi:speckle-type POZ protein B [Caerostris extrusa]|uniref:Speckle-type POZ protein B n=1 Tax=Caerostris extrusa TaxID=172846 RepID=A0AAV4SYH3_CAEEX|nr:speckle-type POZ protein B [Caerostris extrusa]